MVMVFELESPTAFSGRLEIFFLYSEDHVRERLKPYPRGIRACMDRKHTSNPWTQTETFAARMGSSVASGLAWLGCLEAEDRTRRTWPRILARPSRG